MATNFKVAIEINDAVIKQQVHSCLEDIDNIIFRDHLAHAKSQEDSSPQLFVFSTKTQSDSLTEKIKNIRERHPHAALFVISPDKTPDHIVTLMKAGVDEFFPNPLDLGSFKNAIEKVREKLAFMKKTKGRYSDEIILKTDSTIQPELKIRVYGDILGSPDESKKRTLQAGPKAPVSQTQEATPAKGTKPEDASQAVPQTATPKAKDAAAE